MSVCVQAHTSTCSQLVCVPHQGNPQIQVRHFPVPCALKGGDSSCLSGLVRGQGEGVRVSVYDCVTA